MLSEGDSRSRNISAFVTEQTGECPLSAGLDIRIYVISFLRMRTVITTTEAARHLGDLLSRVRFRNEHFILTKNEKPVAELSPANGSVTATWGELCRAVERLPLDATFAGDLEKVNQSDRVSTNPWV